MAPKARQAKGKARLAAYDKLLAEPKAADGRDKDLQINIPVDQAPRRRRSSRRPLSKGFGDKLLIEDLSLLAPPAGIVGVIGANGAGKTTCSA